jgi:hypothetical protein
VSKEEKSEIRELKKLITELADALDYYKHDSGCPAIADDEGDYLYLDDAGECCCRARKCDADDKIRRARETLEKT